MPALPWRTISAPDRDREYVVMGSRLPLVRYRDLPGFLRATMLIRAQLARASGLTGYALDAHLGPEDLLDPPTTFTYWTVSGADLPVAWAEVRRRVAAAELPSRAGCVCLPKPRVRHGPGSRGQREDPDP